MKTLLKTICEDAFHTRENGNFNIIGIFENINTPGFPARHPKMAFALVLEGDPMNEFEYSMEVLNPKGEKIFESPKNNKGNFGPNGRHHLVVRILGIEFKEEGVHTAKIYIGDLEEIIGFNVAKAATAK